MCFENGLPRQSADWLAMTGFFRQSKGRRDAPPFLRFWGEVWEKNHSLIPSIDKGKHGFDGQKCAHTASSPLAIRQVLPAGLFLSGHISAPTKLLAPASDVFSSDFWFLRRGLAGASQGEKGKKRRKDTLSGVFALVNRWYSCRNSPGCRRWACPCRRCRWSGRTENRSGR